MDISCLLNKYGIYFLTPSGGGGFLVNLVPPGAHGTAEIDTLLNLIDQKKHSMSKP
jgi:hypothetical protein